MTAVLRSIASATTLGDGGNGTLDAKERFDKAEARGVRVVNADRARVVAGSASESSLKTNQQAAITIQRAIFAHGFLTSREVHLQPW